MIHDGPYTLPAADIVCDEEMVRVELDVPGFEPHLEVHARGHTVVVRGARRGDSGRYILCERPLVLYRELELPLTADMRNIQACVHKGVLTISAPLGSGNAEPDERRIAVRPSMFACHPDAAAI